MNRISKIFSTIALGGALLTVSSCVNDLDLMPTDPRTITAGEFAQDPEGYMDRVMADVYLQFATYGANGNSTVSGFDGGMSTFQRALFLLEEIPTDEANWLPADAAYGTLQYGIVNPLSAPLYGVYSRLTINIALCNDFIQTVNNGYFNLPDNLTSKADELVRQCKILRSGCYFYLIDLFGDVPYADENVGIGAIAPQMSRAEIYNNVVATLEEVSAAYGSNDKAVYGYVGKDVADALLVKFYLNAGVFTGTPQWAKCYEKANEIIARHKGNGFKGSGLCNYYNQLFAYNNNQYAVGGSNAVSEILWTIPQDVTHLKSWANSTFMLYAWLGYPGPDDEWDVQKEWYNTNDGWKCMTTRKQFAEKFEWDDAAMSTSKDKRVAGWITSAQGFSYDNVVFDQDHFSQNGYLAIKFTNYAIDENGEVDKAASPTPTSQLGGDYPVIRLAEIYLSAAEAALQGGGDKEQARQYVNLIRERAGLDPWDSLSLSQLQDERARELYTENCRRTDLIRYNQWISGYNWDWKNQVRNGADFPAHYNLYPIPSSVITLTGYTQNPGY